MGAIVVFACRINLLKELRDGPLVEVPKSCEGPPCWECHLRDGERCDICGRTGGSQWAQ